MEAECIPDSESKPSHHSYLVVLLFWETILVLAVVPCLRRPKRLLALGLWRSGHRLHLGSRPYVFAVRALTLRL